MIPTGTLRRHWRTTAVALLGASLAFVCSFLVSPTYQASTRLIIHGHDAGFLSSSGQSSTTQPTITDSGQAKALADTYGSIATSRSLAISVVDDLRLDRPANSSGFFHVLGSGAAWLYRCTRAFVTAGFCASVDHREAAIRNVQEGTTAAQVGTTAGSSAGQPGAYVLEITASGESGKQAQDVADAVADELVTSSTKLVEKSGKDYVDRLQTQLNAAREDVDHHAADVTAFEVDNKVSAADQETVVTATSYEQLRSDLSTAQADLADAQAQLDSIEAALNATTSTSSSGQTIDTGRSQTSISTDQTNPVFSDLLTSRSQTEAKISGLTARISVLQKQVASGSPTTLSGTLAKLADLQADLTAAEHNRDTLAGQLADGRAQLATAAPDLTRIDQAGRPDYPTSPKRYLYLLIGLLLGGLAGGGLSWLATRRGTPEPDDDAELGTGEDAEQVATRDLELENELLNGAHVNGQRIPAQAVDGPGGEALIGAPAGESTAPVAGNGTRQEP